MAVKWRWLAGKMALAGGEMALAGGEMALAGGEMGLAGGSTCVQAPQTSEHVVAPTQYPEIVTLLTRSLHHY